MREVIVEDLMVFTCSCKHLFLEKIALSVSYICKFDRQVDFYV